MIRRMLETANIPPKASYRTDEAAQILGLSVQTVYTMMDQYPPEGLRWYRVTAQRRIPFPALVDWMDGRLKESATQDAD